MRAHRLVIRVDLHERPSGVPDELASLGALIELEHLIVGDYVVAPNTAIERKTVRGLHAGVLDGTFWPQIGRLKANCDYPFLLVEGSSVDDGPLGSNSIRGLLVAVTDLGVALLFSTDRTDSARWIVLLAKRRQQLTRPNDRPAYSLRPKQHATPAEAVLAGIPGVSTVIARSLLQEFTSVAGVCAASEKELSRVRGIGQRRAQNIADALHRSSFK